MIARGLPPHVRRRHIKISRIPEWRPARKSGGLPSTTSLARRPIQTMVSRAHKGLVAHLHRSFRLSSRIYSQLSSSQSDCQNHVVTPRAEGVLSPHLRSQRNRCALWVRMLRPWCSELYATYPATLATSFTTQAPQMPGGASWTMKRQLTG
jgi:hypothetical protein